MQRKRKPGIQIVEIRSPVSKGRKPLGKRAVLLRKPSPKRVKLSKETAVLLDAVGRQLALGKPGGKECRNFIVSLGKVPAAERLAVAEKLCLIAEGVMPVLVAENNPALRKEYAKRAIDLYGIASSLFEKAGQREKAEMAEEAIVLLSSTFLL